MKKLGLMGLLLLVLPVICWGVNDEPDELNWERFGNDPHVFRDFQRFWGQRRLPGAQDENCPLAFPAITLRPEAFGDNPGQWKATTQGSTAVLQASYGHNSTAARAA